MSAKMLRLCLAICLTVVVTAANPDYTRANTILKFSSEIPFEQQWADFKVKHSEYWSNDSLCMCNCESLRLTQGILMEKGFVCQNPHPSFQCQNSLPKDLYFYHLFCQNDVWKNCCCQSFLYDQMDPCHILPPPIHFDKCFTNKH